MQLLRESRNAIDLAAVAGRLVEADPDFEAAAPVQLSTLVFRYRPAGGLSDQAVDAVNLHIRRSLAASGRALVAGTTVDGAHYLKFTLLNADTTEADLQDILEQIRQSGAGYLAGAAA